MRLFIAASTVLSLIGTSQALPSPSCQQTHQVVTGETCKSIALKYNHSQSDIQQWNKKLNTQFDCNNLNIGDVICINYASIGKRDYKHDEPKFKPTLTKHHKKPFHTTTVKKHAPAPTHAAEAPKNGNNGQSGQQSGQSDINKRDYKHDEPKPKPTLTKHHKKSFHTTTVKKHAPAPTHAAEAPKNGNNGQSGQQAGHSGQQSGQSDINKRAEHDEPKPKHTLTKHHKKPFHTTTVKKHAPAAIHAVEAPKNGNNGQSGQQQAGQASNDINKRGENNDSEDKATIKDEKKAVVPNKKHITTKKYIPKKHTTTKKHVPKKHTTVKKPIAKKQTAEKSQTAEKKN